jgi:two-component system, chemotaxis family, response regulator Rcp1
MFYDHRCHILHVTDNDPDHRLLVELIQKKPTLVLERASTAAECLDRLRSSPQADRPNLIMIDWMLPGVMLADELLTTLKTDKIFRSIPVLVFTSTIQPGEIDRIYGLGANCVIFRNFDLDEFVEAVEMIYGFWGTIASLPYCDPAKPATA